MLHLSRPYFSAVYRRSSTLHEEEARQTHTQMQFILYTRQ